MRKSKKLARGELILFILALTISLIQYAVAGDEILFVLAASKTPAQHSGAVVPNQAVVRIESGKAVGEFLPEFRGTAIRSIRGRNIFLITFPESFPIDNVTTALRNKRGVRFAHPNYVYELPEINQMDEFFPDQNDPAYLEGLSPQSFYVQQDTGIIGSDPANDLSTGANTVVAIIDNGVEFDHPLLENSFANNGYDFIDSDADPSEEYGNMVGHGTFVSGLVKLVAPGCRLIPYRTFDENGLGNCFDITQAIYQAIDDSADVINMSFNMYSSNSLIEDAVAEAHQAGLTMVASSGNDGSSSPCYPASYDGVIAVSAIDSLDYLAGFSNYGAYVDVCGYGVYVYSSLDSLSGYHWGRWSGTSFSGPQVSGVCALIIDLRPDFSGDEVENHVRLTADEDLQWGSIVPHDSAYGYGRIDAFEAALYLRRGDVDDSREIDSLDVNYLIDFLHNGGPEPIPIYELGDADCSGVINTLDVSYLINYLFHSGPAPGCQ